MKNKILFLPFLQIPSGHHQAATALMDGVKQIRPEIVCEKIDILSYSYGGIERLVSNVYLNWIDALPGLYNAIYKNAVYKNTEKTKRYRLYEILFLSFMKKLIKKTKPDLIVCTHALPAYMLNYMKKNGDLKTPVINVYTDYFIHRFWGVEQIDFHFVPSVRMKHFLYQKGVNAEQIYITGIPIHTKIRKQRQPLALTKQGVYNVLISGGSLGVGAIWELIQKLAETEPPYPIQFKVLCGKNQQLCARIKAMQKPHIFPLPYIDCKEEMNHLYEKTDAVITKPGGVTVSECLFKRKPIFIYNALPGQEKINQQQLTNLGLVYKLEPSDIYGQLFSVLGNINELNRYQEQVENYHSNLHLIEPHDIIAELLV